MTAALLPVWAFRLQRRMEGAARSCGRKNRYDCEAIARRAAQTSLQSDRFAAGSRLYVYPCVRCRGWHLTRSVTSGAPVTATQRWEGVSA